jgi:TatD DNase family protein
MKVMIDTHAHMYADAFDEDRAETMQRAFDAGLTLVALPNIDSASIGPLRALMEAFPDQTIGMMGLHPSHVKDDYKAELQKIEAELDRGKYHAVGEIGIDLYWDKTYLPQQVDAFITQIGWAKKRGLPIVIHARESFDEIFEIMDAHCDERLSGVFHCFTGNLVQARKALSYPNFYLGIGGVVTFKNGGLDKVLPGVGIDRLVLETDAPYLAPAPFRGKRNESAYSVLVAEKSAEIFNVSTTEVERITTMNARKLFKLDE